MLGMSIGRSGELEFTQKFTRPSVYLDHWAIRHFSENKELRERFVQILKKQNGTLALSIMNMLEFTKSSNPNWIRTAENFLQEIYPNIFLMESDVFCVWEKEMELSTAPHSLQDAHKFFLSIQEPSDTGIFGEFGMKNIFEYAKEMREYRNQLIHHSAQAIKRLRADYDSDAKFQKSVKSLNMADLPRTQIIHQELYRATFLMSGFQPEENHIIDFLHTVVPASYCDFALLDKNWARQVEIIQPRLEEMGIRLAIPFSRRHNGINRLFTELKNFRTAKIVGHRAVLRSTT